MVIMKRCKIIISNEFFKNSYVRTWMHLAENIFEKVSNRMFGSRNRVICQRNKVVGIQGLIKLKNQQNYDDFYFYLLILLFTASYGFFNECIIDVSEA